MGCLLAERDRALLAALAADEHELLLEVDVGEVEPHRLRASQAGGVDELEQGTVAERERLVASDQLEQAIDLVGLRRLGQALDRPRRKRGLGHPRGTEGEAKERADRRDPPRDRRGRELRSPASELRHVVREHPNVDVVQTGAAALEPAREVPKIEAVRAPGRRREPR